ncbi:OmpA family protein [Pseudomonas azotoformans]
MSLRLYRILYLWAGALALALLVIIPLGMGVRVLGMLMAVGCVVLAWVLLGRRAARQRDWIKWVDKNALPALEFRHPVVLVCGDSLDGLFGSVPVEPLSLRVIEHCCYVRVPNLERLPAVADAILASRPGWGAQLSVMFTVNPGAHSDGAVLAGHIRAFSHQASLVRKRGIPLPLLLVSYLQTSLGEHSWFSWDNGQADVRVHEAGACISLTQWQQSAQAARMPASVQLNSVVAWLHDAVLPHFATRHSSGLAVVCAVKWVPALPHAVKGNLWQQWLCNKVALVDNRPVVTDAVLPFPDPLLSLLPLGPLRSPICDQLQLLLRSLATTAHSEAALVQLDTELARLHARLAPQLTSPLLTLQALRYQVGHLIQRLERNLVVGEAVLAPMRVMTPMLVTPVVILPPPPVQPRRRRMALWLFAGLLMVAVLAGFGWRTWLMGPSSQPPMPEPVRLDSLSLFDAGSATLKPHSTKVLINALVGIKAQPGWLIVIAGHSDATGAMEQNMTLSHARASAVRDWMQRMGDIPDSCFAVQGLAANQPIASNETEAGRTANRRVDIQLVPQVGACEQMAPTG